ncbi:MAG TPA: proline dehydrogenase family protein [Thermodesulfobacteriota bacterium]
MLRQVLLALSHRPAIGARLERSGLTRGAVRRFVAGTDIPDVLAAVRALPPGCAAALTYLGENVATAEAAGAAAEVYRRTVREALAGGLSPSLSVKLTQLGLDLGDAVAVANARAILEEARRGGLFVRIDMEGSAYTDRTLALHETLAREFDNVGVAIQAYLYRSERDLDRLIQAGANVRLVKGAYREPPELAYPKKRDVDAAFLRLITQHFSALARGARGLCAVATHDPHMVAHAEAEAARLRLPRDRFEFQLLYGIGADLRDRLLAAGYRVRVLVPFGESWYGYFMRRLAERPANLLFVLRAALQGG